MRKARTQDRKLIEILKIFYRIAKAMPMVFLVFLLVNFLHGTSWAL